jgi:hypothetical protein
VAAPRGDRTRPSRDLIDQLHVAVITLQKYKEQAQAGRSTRGLNPRAARAQVRIALRRQLYRCGIRPSSRQAQAALRQACRQLVTERPELQGCLVDYLANVNTICARIIRNMGS